MVSNPFVYQLIQKFKVEILLRAYHLLWDGVQRHSVSPKTMKVWKFQFEKKNCYWTEGETSNVLREIQVPVVTEQKCKEAFKSFRNVAIDNRVICAGYAKGGKDTCQVKRFSFYCNMRKQNLSIFNWYRVILEALSCFPLRPTQTGSSCSELFLWVTSVPNLDTMEFIRGPHHMLTG